MNIEEYIKVCNDKKSICIIQHPAFSETISEYVVMNMKKIYSDTFPEYFPRLQQFKVQCTYIS